MLNIVLSLMIGSLGVLQNTFNKKIAETLGIATTVLINNFFLFLFGVLFYCFVRYAPQYLPEIFHVKDATPKLSYRYMLPAFCGFLIIVTAPFAIERIGAAKVFLAIIVAQLFTSFLWDYFVENITPSNTKIIGATLAAIGTIISFL